MRLFCVECYHEFINSHFISPLLVKSGVGGGGGSEIFSAVLWDIDLKFGIWFFLDMTQIKFGFCPVPPIFTGVIALCKNFVFQTFLSFLLWYWPEICNMNLSWHDTDQVRLLSRLTYFYMSYCPLLKFLFPDFSLSSFDIFTWDFRNEAVLT